MATARKTPAKKAEKAKPATRTTPVALSPIAAPAAAPKAKTKAGKKDGKKADDKPAKPQKAEKPRKPKLVRDGFTMPKDEYAAIDALKARAARAGRPAKKSEILRAGLKALGAMADSAFLSSLKAIPSIKTGRPPKAA